MFLTREHFEKRIMSETYTLKIKSGRNNIRKKRFYFWIRNFEYNKRSKGHDFYQKKECQEQEKIRIQRMCKRKGFEFTAIPTRYSRSRNYRTMFFRENPSYSGKYRCVYCGRKFKKEKITVDHIFPIHEMETSSSVRRRAALHGIHGSNDVKNLCAACKRCNLKKGTRMGRWILKAFLGRTVWFWPTIQLIRVSIICLILYKINEFHPEIFMIVKKEFVSNGIITDMLLKMKKK